MNHHAVHISYIYHGQPLQNPDLVGILMKPKKVLIMGAAGRDFHNFNVLYRDDPDFIVVAFTAAQIPGIEGKRYPPELSGSRYPEGIPIHSEKELESLIQLEGIDLVVFAYSDVPHEYVMHKASVVNAAGADFILLGKESTMIPSNKPVIAICATRTGCGKSQTSRHVMKILKEHGKTAVAIRHPMPYGELKLQAVQRFASYDDLDTHECTIEEREEYEPHIDEGLIVFAGVDYEKILQEAEKEADAIVWDGGNNDFSFIKADCYLTVTDPHRAGHGVLYYPGETNLYLADAVLINKEDSAKAEDIYKIEKMIQKTNPEAMILHCDSPVTIADPDAVKGKKVLVVEDGPTVTHGGMPFGAGLLAAQQNGASEIVDARPYAVGSIKDTFEKFTHLEEVLPAMGYSPQQVKELEDTINAVPCDVVLSGTPIDLSRIIDVNKPLIRVKYVLEEKGKPDLVDVFKETGIL